MIAASQGHEQVLWIMTTLSYGGMHHEFFAVMTSISAELGKADHPRK